MTVQPVDILLVEDNPGDVVLMREALREAKMHNTLHVAPDGREVLAAIKDDPALRRIPVVMLTTSDAPSDVRAAYDRHVNSYITKPVDLEQFFAVVKGLDGYWLSLVRLSLE